MKRQYSNMLKETAFQMMDEIETLKARLEDDRKDIATLVDELSNVDDLEAEPNRDDQELLTIKRYDAIAMKVQLNDIEKTMCGMADLLTEHDEDYEEEYEEPVVECSDYCRAVISIHSILARLTEIINGK